MAMPRFCPSPRGRIGVDDLEREAGVVRDGPRLAQQRGTDGAATVRRQHVKAAVVQEERFDGLP
jgi:hypothetical protein